MNLKDMVSDGKQVTFIRYKHQMLWYVTECGFEFPVPVSDTGDAEFAAQDKATFFMRWIRKQIQAIKEEKRNMETQG